MNSTDALKELSKEIDFLCRTINEAALRIGRIAAKEEILAGEKRTKLQCAARGCDGCSVCEAGK